MLERIKPRSRVIIRHVLTSRIATTVYIITGIAVLLWLGWKVCCLNVFLVQRGILPAFPHHHRPTPDLEGIIYFLVELVVVGLFILIFVECSHCIRLDVEYINDGLVEYDDAQARAQNARILKEIELTKQAEREAEREAERINILHRAKINEYTRAFSLFDKGKFGTVSMGLLRHVIVSLGKIPSEDQLKHAEEKYGTFFTFDQFVDIMAKYENKSF